MNWKQDCAVIIPCLNEAAAIGMVVKRVRELLPKIIVVDDGSTDETASIAKQNGAAVLKSERRSLNRLDTNPEHHRADSEIGAPRGKGAALQTGWRHACDAGIKWALTMDGDGQHAAADIPKFLERAEKTSADLVVGNRMRSPDKMPLIRRFVNRWMSARISKLTGCPLPDSQCGFRLVNLDALGAMQIEAEHFEIESEVLQRFALAGRRIEFVPIQVIYKSEQSKIHPLRDTLRWISWWRRMQRLRQNSELLCNSTQMNADRIVAPAK